MTHRALVDWWLRASRQDRAEVLAAVAGIAGWVLITWTLAAIFGWKVWPASMGVLLLAGPGIRTIGRLLWTGALGESLADEEREG
jgi:hypothetical protein